MHKYRINLGLRTTGAFKWSRDDQLVFAENCLGEGDMVEWIKATAIIHTNDPDAILDAMLDHDYSVVEDGTLRWINVGRSENRA